VGKPQAHRSKGETLKYDKPEVMDLGSIGDHTFTTPSGSLKGTTGHDPHGELSDHTVGT
jgi:hypothetical protein